MSLEISFPSPVTMNGHSVSAVRLASLAVNFQAAHVASGNAVSAMLIESTDGTIVCNPQFTDAASLALVRSALAAINPATGNTFEHDLLAKAQTWVDPTTNAAAIPAGTIQQAN